MSLRFYEEQNGTGKKGRRNSTEIWHSSFFIMKNM